MSKQFKAIFILTLLVLNSECGRILKINAIMDHDLDLEDKCSALEGKVARLSEYIKSKVNKVKTKGVAGFYGATRVRRLAQRTAALAAATKSFQEEGCKGDLSAANTQLASVKAVIKNLASSGGETTSTLSRAISQTEVELAKPPEERRSAYFIQARFMKTLMGGDGEMTETEKKAVIVTKRTEAIVGDALHEADKDLLSEDEDLLGRRNNDNDSADALDESQVAQFEQVSANTASSKDLVPVVTGLLPVDIFVSGLKLMSQFLSIIILGVIGVVWWFAHVFTMPGSVALALGSAAASSIICALWWLVGQMAEFVSSGAIVFGDIWECMETVWVTPFAKPLAVANILAVNGNPWMWMGSFVKGIGKLGQQKMVLNESTVEELGEAWQATVQSEMTGQPSA